MPSSSPPVILISNDDGVHADGIRALEAALAPLGRIFTVAPETEQSAASHAITLARPLRLRHHGGTRYGVDGTPVDSVYIALNNKGLLPARPAVLVSGINHGPNLGSDVFYSGTVAAAREGALRGIPAVAVSLGRGGSRELAGELARRVVERLLADKRALQKRTVLLNLNVPPGPVRGLRATSLGERLYEDLVEMRTDPRGGQYLWIGGPSVTHPPSEGTDTRAWDDGYASLTPLSIDLVRHDQLELTAALAAAASAAPLPKPTAAANGRAAASSGGAGSRTPKGGTKSPAARRNAPARRAP